MSLDAAFDQMVALILPFLLRIFMGNLGTAKNRLSMGIKDKAEKNESLSADDMIVVSDEQVPKEIKFRLKVLPGKP